MAASIVLAKKTKPSARTSLGNAGRSVCRTQVLFTNHIQWDILLEDLGWDERPDILHSSVDEHRSGSVDGGRRRSHLERSKCLKRFPAAAAAAANSSERGRVRVSKYE